ncbi:hypothetical protein VE03_07580 [Pseudogymnoascus sp. 23342-1-I1]|nr:hypothetical protein VE03_07580 [Pseudogymnoascus sp. 23342-1-I1]
MLSLLCILTFLLSLTLSQHSPPQFHSPSQSKSQPAPSRPPSPPNHTTWTSLVLTHHGERRPPLTTAFPTLTPLGATQAFSSGSLLRSRYLTGVPSNLTTFSPLQGFHKNYLDSQRIQVLAGPEQYTVASAWAFLQGLYPPVDVPGVVGGSRLAGGKGVEAPLGGYQYGRVETAGGGDWNSVWIAGNDHCPSHALSTAHQLNTTTYKNTSLVSAPFYASTIPAVFRGTIPDPMVTYHNAIDLYEYAAYAKLHNDTVATKLPTASLTRLRALAAQRLWGIHGSQGASGAGDDDEWSGVVKPIAGRTFAARVVSLLSGAMSARPGALNLLFSGSAPFVGFSAISGLAEHDARFKGVVEPGSMMVFEVFSYTDPEAGVPGKEDLWVRFLYRNGTAENNRLMGYPLFGRGRSKMDMRFAEFEEEMGGVAVGVGEWCEGCEAGSVFCPAFREALEKARKEGGEKEGGGGGGKEGGKEGGKKKKSKKATAVELGLGLGAAGVVLTGMMLTFLIYARRGERKKAEGYGNKERERAGGEGPGSWEMGDRTPKEGEGGAGRGQANYPVQNEEGLRSMSVYSVHEEEEEAVNPLREPVRVEDRV